LIAVGGFSHLLLDVIAHGTPLLYPVSMVVFSVAPNRVVQGGVWAYLTDPVFLFEPLLFGAAFIHWVHQRSLSPIRKRQISWVIVSGLVLFSVGFALALPGLQKAVVPLISY